MSKVEEQIAFSLFNNFDFLDEDVNDSAPNSFNISNDNSKSGSRDSSQERE